MEQGSGMAGEPVGITFDNVNISYGKNQVIKDVNLKIEPGEFFTFLGPSGSGKSTLLRAIAGFGPRPTGRILIGDEDVTDLPPWKRNVGMVFQSYALWPHMTVRKNVAFGLEEHHVPRDQIARRVEEALRLVGLLEFADRRPSQLSGGQQQRVALARTIVIRPRVLLLDEPLSNLDANLRIQMRRELRDLQRELKLTTVFVTHDQEEANTISDRIAVLDGGVIQQVGSPMELYDRPANRFVAHFLGTANIVDGHVVARNGASEFRSEDGIVVPLGRGVSEGRAILFRPQSLTIRPKGEAARTGVTALSGTVQHSEFLGGLIRYSIKVGNQVLLVDDAHQKGQRTYAPGEEVDLVLAADQVLVLND